MRDRHTTRAGTVVTRGPQAPPAYSGRSPDWVGSGRPKDRHFATPRPGGLAVSRTASPGRPRPQAASRRVRVMTGAGSVPPLVLGCCGWDYKDWRGPFYPLDAGPRTSSGSTRRPSAPSRSTARSTVRRRRRRCGSGATGRPTLPVRAEGPAVDHAREAARRRGGRDRRVPRVTAARSEARPAAPAVPAVLAQRLRGRRGVPARPGRVPRGRRPIVRIAVEIRNGRGSTTRSSTCCATTARPPRSPTSSGARRRRTASAS